MHGGIGVEFISFRQGEFSLIEREMIEEGALLHRRRCGESLTLESTRHFANFLRVISLSTVRDVLDVGNNGAKDFYNT